LTDFNTASPLYYRYNPTRSRPIAKEQCPYYMQKAKGKYRAPEEMLHNDDDGGNPVSEKIDVYSLGNILYELLTGERKYLDLEKDEAQVLIINGHVPPNILSFLIPDITNDSIEYRINHALSKAILICFERDPTKRATAKQVYDLLLNEWRQLI
jgi:serine/threonine protein kinase